MSLEHDPRTGSEDSGAVTVASTDGDTPQTVYYIPSDALFKVTDWRVEYPSDDATVATAAALYDEPDGTAAGSVSDERDSFDNITASEDRVSAEGPLRVFEEDVLVQTDGNQDAGLSVVVKGVLLTDLKDQAGF